MTEETIKQLQELLQQKAAKLYELSEYDELLKAKPDDISTTFYVSGWHSAEKKMSLPRMPKKMFELLKVMRNDLRDGLTDIQRKIDEL